MNGYDEDGAGVVERVHLASVERERDRNCYIRRYMRRSAKRDVANRLTSVEAIITNRLFRGVNGVAFEWLGTRIFIHAEEFRFLSIKILLSI